MHRIGRKSRQNGSQIGPMWLSRLGARTVTTKSCYPGDPRPPNWSRFGVEWLYFGASWCPIRFFLALARNRLGIHDFLCSTNLDAPNTILYLDQLCIAAFRVRSPLPPPLSPCVLRWGPACPCSYSVIGLLYLMYLIGAIA